jgi:hypothetical protein
LRRSPGDLRGFICCEIAFTALTFGGYRNHATTPSPLRAGTFGEKPGAHSAGLIQVRRITPMDFAVFSSRSGRMRAIEKLRVYPLAFHSAREAGETDSAMQMCVPQPSASAPTRYHAMCCALRGRG